MTKEDLKNYLIDEDNNGEAWDLLVEIGLELSGTDSFPFTLSYYENNRKNFNKAVEDLKDSGIHLSHYDIVKISNTNFYGNYYDCNADFFKFGMLDDQVYLCSIFYSEYADRLYRSIDTVVNCLIEEAKKAPGYFRNVSSDPEFNEMLIKLISE